MYFCVQRIIQELFEVYFFMDDVGFLVKVEEFVVFFQEFFIIEIIVFKIVRFFIEVRIDLVCFEELFDKELGLF